MTTLASTPVPTASTTDAPRRPLLPRLGGGVLLTVPLLMTGAVLTSPSAKDDTAAGYIESLAKDSTLTALSAGLFHYAWIAIAFGALAAATLVPGRRGRALTAVGAVASAFGGMQFSGLLFSDWFLDAAGSTVPMTDAVAIFTAVTEDPWVSTWLLSAKVFGLLGLPVLLAGLARAGVIGWWTVPVILLPMVVTGMLAAVVGGVVAGLAGLLFWAPLALVGLRLIRRPAIRA